MLPAIVTVTDLAFVEVIVIGEAVEVVVGDLEADVARLCDGRIHIDTS